MLVTRKYTMAGLYIVKKRLAAAAMDARADRSLRQLAAMDRALDAMDQVCDHLSNASDRAVKLRTKLQSGMATFIDTWNEEHPDQRIQHCRGAETNSACARYTTNEQALCDGCWSQRSTT